MNRKELIKKISAETGFKKKSCRNAVETAFDLISQELIKGNEVNIEEFGKFFPKNRGVEIFNDGSFVAINPPSVKIEFDSLIRNQRGIV
ncbi:MAG: HU family DNA-binding protein [Bacteroidetes bacterium]|nr:HU family DNA-binding protein [Bacteroidota bacterium]